MPDLTAIPPMLRFLLEAAHQAPSADNTQPWCFHLDGDRLTLRYDAVRVASALSAPDRHITLLAMGAVIENLEQAAAAAGVSLQEIEPGPEDRSTTFLDVRVTAQGAPVPEELGSHPIFARHTNRHPYRSDPVEADVVAALRAVRAGGVRVVVLTERAPIEAVADGVRIASEARFQSRELHEWLMSCLRWSPAEVARGDGLDVKTLHLPLGGKLLVRGVADWNRMRAFNRIGGYRVLAAIEAALVAKGPALLAVVGPESRADALSAGRLLERAWLLLAEKGLAAHPYYVLPDYLQRRAKGEVSNDPTGSTDRAAGALRDALELGADETLHMLFRIGHPKHSPVRSLRLPLESVVTRA